MKVAQTRLPYFKQGDDLHVHITNAGSVAAGLESHAESMDAAARKLRAIKAIVAGHPVEIDADVHCIRIEGPDAVIDRLIAEGLAKPFECDDEDEFEDEGFSVADSE